MADRFIHFASVLSGARRLLPCLIALGCADSPPAPVPAPVSSPPATTASTVSLTENPVPLSAPLSGLLEKSPSDRDHVLAGLQNAYDLPEADVAFLRHAIQSRDLDPLTRNNIANILVQQERRDPQLYRVFLGMVQDETEEPLWRDYALQHLAATAGFAEDPTAVGSTLLEIFDRGKGPIVGTAMIHLDQLEEAGRITAADFNDRIAAVARDPDRDLPTRTSAFALLGRRGSREYLYLVRETVIHGEQPSLKRAAIGALGLLGEEKDLLLLESLADHSDPSVALAAQAAVQNLSHPQPRALDR